MYCIDLHETQCKCKADRDPLGKRSVDLGDEPDRHDENYQVKRHSEAFIREEEVVLLDTVGLYIHSPKPLHRAAAKDADKYLGAE